MSRGNIKRKEPFKSKCDSDMDRDYFMAYGLIESISMRTFVEGALSLELPLSKHYVFPNHLIYLFIFPLIIFASPLYKVSSYNITTFTLEKMQKG
jgi:hypothetical protein